MATILVVDDRPANREFLVTLLGYQNHRLLEASDGAEALTLVKSERPDLVITDVLMPTMDGYEFVHQLRADPAIASTAVIFFTAHYHRQEAQSLAKSCGVGHILTKPCEPELILRIVEKSLGTPMQITAPWLPQDFNHEHLRVVTDKLSQTADELGTANLRMGALIDISLQLASERNPRQLLNNMCRAARDLLGARYALLAVDSRDNGNDAYFVTSGMDTATAADLSPPSLQDGTVGTAFTQRKASRLSHIGGDPQAVGLPAGYPPVHSLLVAPIVSLAHVYGWICLTNKVGATGFSEEDERLLAILAAQVGRIYENGSLYLEIQKHAEELEAEIAQRKLAQEKVERLNRVYAVLSGINTLIVRVRDRQELFNEACRIAVEHGGFGIAWIDLLNRKTFEITPVAWAGPDAEQMTRTPHTVRPDTQGGQGLSGRAIRSQQAVFDNDITADLGVGGERRKEMIRRGYRSGIALPLLLDGEVAGIISLFTREASFFNENELRLLNELAGDISFALEHIGKEEKIARLSRIQAVMSRINALIVRERDRKKLFEETCDIAVRHGGFGIAWVGVLNQETLEITPAACAGVDAESLLAHSQNTAQPDTPMGQGLVGRAIREKRALFSNDITIEPGVGGARRMEAIRRGYRSAISLPLLVEGNVAGNLSLFAKEANFFTADELELLEELSGDISFALDHIGKEEKLGKLSRMRTVSSEINAAIVRIRERETLLQEICRIAEEHGKFELVWIGLLDHKMQKVRPVAWAGFSSETAHAVNWKAIGAVRASLAEVMRTRKIAVRNNIESEARTGVLRQEALNRGCRSTVCLPLVVDDAVVAAIILFATGTNFFDEDELGLLNEVAADVSFALKSIAQQEKLNYLAYYDVLTGLPNRTLFHERLAHEVHSARQDGNKAAVLMLCVKRFHHINDTLGRQAGDAVLRELAQRLKRFWPEPDHVARIGGDGFAGIFSKVKEASEIAHVFQRALTDSFDLPFTVDSKDLTISVAAGIALYPADGEDADTLLRNAEAALKKAKTAGERYLFYEPRMNATVAASLMLENKLRRALDKEQFVLHYQPKVELGTGRIVGLEALIRWNDPETGLVPPVQFIPLLEETGLILDAGRWAIRKALADYRDWGGQGLQPPRIAVNVSPIQLRQKDFVEMVRNTIAESNVVPHGLDLEITESLIMEDIEGNIHKLKALRDTGVNIAIDDFGTGYSSLGYLARLPVNSLKIDRSFIITMTDDPDSMTIVSMIISLAHSLKLMVIAEGVETEEQSRFLKLLKCDEMQGYLFSKPLPAELLVKMLGKRTQC